MRSPPAQLCLYGGVSILLMLLALQFHLPGALVVGSADRESALIAVLMVSLIPYLLAVRVVVRREFKRGAIWIVLGVAVLLRAILLLQPPFPSTDIFRYVWDGRVQAAGINPYLYLPSDPALQSLRDLAVFPNINRADVALTIYPPMAQLIFAAVGSIGGGVIAMKIAMLGFDCLAILCVGALVGLAGLPRARLLIYAWNPLVLWSFALDGHIDAAASGLLALALLLRARHRDGLAGATLALATLVKFLPIVVAPAFARGGNLLRPLLAGLATIFVLYGIYASVGWQVLGFLGGYSAEEGLDSGAGIWLLAGLSRLTTLPHDAVMVYGICATAAFTWLGLTIMRAPAGPACDDIAHLCRDCALLASVAMVAISPHYHWYFAWLAVPAVIAANPAFIWLASAPLLLYLDPFEERFIWPSLIYVPALVLFLKDRWRLSTPLALSQGDAV